MRKGRSQRKARASLMPLSTRPHASGAADQASRPVRGPQVVIGLTRREEALEAHSVRGGAEPDAAPLLELLAEPTLELVREAERLELVHDEGPNHEDRQEAEGSDSLSSVECDARFERPSDPFAAALTAETPAPHATALLTPDEMSIPPMGDLAVEPVAERFFSEGELVVAHGDGEEDAWDQHDKAQRKSLPHVVERRQRLSRYVRWAVGGAAVVCLAALARTTMMPRLAGVAAAEMPLTTTTAAEGLAPLAAAQPTEPIKPAEPASAAATPPATPPAAEPASAVAPRVDVPKAAEATKGDEVKPAAAALPTGDKTALQEKNDSRRSLERGKLADAIEAGERSVALDPQDGEAWLLLGAAYQEKGKGAEARRCYTSCLKEGKRGPLGECRAMIR